jgi:hypothetical protein
MLGFGPWNIPSDGRYAWPPAPECIRCGEAPRVSEYGYCFQCHCAVRVEIDAGFEALGEYLCAWRLFTDWCGERGQRIA